MIDLDSLPQDLLSLGSFDPESIADRLSIQQLLSLYSHLVDDFDTAMWGEVFCDDATFEVRFARGGKAGEWVLEGKRAIRDSIASRQKEFRALGAQRRHFLTNPVVLDLTSDSARVMVYLQLANIGPERGFEIEASGRYDGIVIKTPSGWRIKRWRMTADGDGQNLVGIPDSE